MAPKSPRFSTCLYIRDSTSNPKNYVFVFVHDKNENENVMLVVHENENVKPLYVSVSVKSHRLRDKIAIRT